MKKLIVMIAVTISFSGLADATDFMVELKGHYFSPSEKTFRDIYGGGMMYGAEASIGVWRELEIWFGGSYFSKKGELTFTIEETKLRIVPIGVGVRYSFPIHEMVNIYGGIGINYYSYKEENPIGEVSKDGLGTVVKGGGLVKLVKGLIIDAYIGYSYCKIKPADFDINIGGIEAGIGLGYEF